jgi:hypothetical protein
MLSCLCGVSPTTFRANGCASTSTPLALDIMRRRTLIRTAGILFVVWIEGWLGREESFELVEEETWSSDWMIEW